MIDVTLIFLFFFVILPVAVVVGAVVFFLRLLRSSRGDGAAVDQPSPPDEAALLRELHQGLQRLEQRVGSLETIMDLDVPEGEKDGGTKNKEDL